MPNDTVRANARSLPPDRRAFLRLATAASAGALTLSPVVAIAEAAAPPAPATFDLPAALAGWRAAWAKVEAGLKRADMHFWTPPMPEALREQPGDRRELTDLQSVDEDDRGLQFFSGEYGQEAADQIRHWKEEGFQCWPERKSDDAHPWRRKARARAEEILATFEAWKAEREEAIRASGIREAEAAVGAAMWDRKHFADDALRAPAGAEAIALKLRIFADFWREDPGEAATIDDFDDAEESPAATAAVAVALDLLTLVRGCAADAAPNAFQSLGAVAAGVLRSVGEARS
jgi:hypothetical protein